MKGLRRDEFEEIAQKAFDSLPDDFKSRVENVHIAVEDYPSEDVLEGRNFERTSLLGLYQGIPLTKRGVSYGMYPAVPDKISLYQKNIEAYSKDEKELEKRIIEVLFHELGHYFGMEEHEILRAMKRFNI